LFYSAIGQAGGKGYVALMGRAGFAPTVIKPAALALNVLVSAIGCVRFHRAGLLTWRTCYPFAILGLPSSVLGGALHLSAAAYQPIVGLLLLLAGIQLLRPGDNPHEVPIVPFLPALFWGGMLEFVSGVTGVGGGIFLAPLVLMLGWAGPRRVAAISAVFIFLNSAAALAGTWDDAQVAPELPLSLLCVGAGGFLGSWLAAFYFKSVTLRKVLALLLLAERCG
jgi:uncharacterized membrane protein YfcA